MHSVSWLTPRACMTDRGSGMMREANSRGPGRSSGTVDCTPECGPLCALNA